MLESLFLKGCRLTPFSQNTSEQLLLYRAANIQIIYEPTVSQDLHFNSDDYSEVIGLALQRQSSRDIVKIYFILAV